MRILLTGAGGQVGTEFLRAGGVLGEVVGTTRAQCDFADPEAIRRVVRAVQPDVIVNAAAYTAVDKAESDPEASFAANAIAPGILAEEAQRIGALLVHYSTDYVFDGAKSTPYTEDDEPSPLGEYGRSKLEGERRVLASGARALVLRTSWVYSPHGKNFLLTILRLAQERSELRIVADQFGSPTSAKEIASATVRILGEGGDRGPLQPASGIYHLTAHGVTSWCDFAQAILRHAELSAPPAVIAIPTAGYPTPARRPANSDLSNEKFMKTFRFRLGPWEDALVEVLREIPGHSGVRPPQQSQHPEEQSSAHETDPH